MNIEKELSQYNVSRETLAKIQKFVDLLIIWNQKMNLVSHNSLNCVWERHVMDSLQLIKYIPLSTNHLLDIGSGSGFPAVVLAILMQDRIPSAKITMVESITKKTLYLNDVCEKLSLNNVEVINSRVENYAVLSPDIITARAVASLNVLCRYMAKIGHKNTEALFLKGCSYKSEIDEAQKIWQFDLQIHSNLYSEDGVVLQLKNLRKRK